MPIYLLTTIVCINVIKSFYYKIKIKTLTILKKQIKYNLKSYVHINGQTIKISVFFNITINEMNIIYLYNHNKIKKKRKNE